MKKTIFLWIAMLLGTASIFAQSGTTGSLGWTLDNGTLTISVTGAMKDYNGYSRAPWYSYRSSITTIVIGNGVTSIGDGAFSGCSSLTAVTIPNSVTSIGNSAFQYCSSLTAVTIPNSVTSIGSYAFAICSSLTAVTIPNNVTSIGDGAFYGCSSLTAVTIPNSVTSIGESIFGNCSNLTAVITKSENEYFSSNNGVLFNKEQTILVCYPSGKKGNYIIPNSVTSIGNYAFSGCSSLTAVTIPNSVTSIGYGAFFDCSSLTAVTIPNSVTSIGNSAFYNCSSLTAVTNRNPNPQSITAAFDDLVLSNITLYVPATSVAAYKAAEVWKDFGTITAYIPAGKQAK